MGVPQGLEKQCLICSIGSFSQRHSEATQVNVACYNKSRNANNKGGRERRTSRQSNELAAGRLPDPRRVPTSETAQWGGTRQG